MLLGCISEDFIKLEVSDVSNGCISLSTINKNASVDLFQTVCDVVNTMDFEIVGQVRSFFLCLRIERSGTYCFTVVRLSMRPSVCPSVCLHKLNMKT